MHIRKKGEDFLNKKYMKWNILITSGWHNIEIKVDKVDVV